MKKAYRIFAILLVFLIGLGLRLYAANHLVIVEDEPIYTGTAVRYASHIRAHRWNMLAWEDRNLEHPVLFKILYGFVESTQRPPKINIQVSAKRFSPIQGNVGEKWIMPARYTSLLIGALGVLVLALINPLAGLFLAVQSLAILYTSSVYLEALPLVGSLLCAIFYLKWFQTQKPGEKVPPVSYFWLFLSSGALGATAASKYLYSVVGLAIVIHFLIFAPRKKIFTRAVPLMLAWGLFSLFAFFAFDPYLWPHPIQRLRDSLNYSREYSQSDDVKQYNYPFWQVLYWLSGSVSTHLPNFKQGMLLALDLPISLLAIAGLPRLWKKDPFYLIWLLTGILVLFAWPTHWTQYTLIIIAPYCISAAAGLQWIITWLKGLIWKKPVPLLAKN